MNRPARARRRVSRCRASRARAVLGAAVRESCVNRHGSAVDTHRSHAPAGSADQRSDALLKRNVGFRIWTANIQAAENASHVPSIKNVDYVALTRNRRSAPAEHRHRGCAGCVRGPIDARPIAGTGICALRPRGGDKVVLNPTVDLAEGRYLDLCP
jgi:hypothetical protein